MEAMSETVYVGKLIRDEIKRQYIKNMYVVKRMNEMEIEMTDTRFSNKVHGDRDKFTKEEVKAINKILKTKFPLPDED